MRLSDISERVITSACSTFLSPTNIDSTLTATTPSLRRPLPVSPDNYDNLQPCHQGWRYHWCRWHDRWVHSMWTLSLTLPSVVDVHNVWPRHPATLLWPVLLAGWEMEQRRFGGREDLDCSAPRVQWLRTPLCRKAEAQGTKLSKPKRKGTCLIGNSRGIAVQVRQLLSGSGKALNHLLL